MKYVLVLFLFLVTLNINASLWWRQGYIITNDGVTVYGEVYVPRHSQTTGDLVIFGIDLEGFYNRVRFKCDGAKKNYSPEMIREFGFTHKGEDYKFESSCLHYKSLVKSERTTLRFLNVVHRGSISLLRDCRMLQHAVNAGRNSDTEYLTYYDYYLYSADSKLIRLFSFEETKVINVVLERLGMAPRFLDRYGKIKVRHLTYILYQYDLWLSEQKEPEQLII